MSRLKRSVQLNRLIGKVESGVTLNYLTSEVICKLEIFKVTQCFFVKKNYFNYVFIIFS